MIPRYTRPEISAIWSPQSKFRIWFEIEAHAADALAELGVILWREIAGIAFLAVYFLVLPFVLGRTLMRDFRRRMGPVGFTIMTWLLLMMIMLPLKMILRWTLNLSYIVSIPEYFANF